MEAHFKNLKKQLSGKGKVVEVRGVPGPRPQGELEVKGRGRTDSKTLYCFY